MRRLASILVLIASFTGAAAVRGAELLNGISVIVNGEVITLQDVEASIGRSASLLASQYAGQPQVFQQKLGELRAARVAELVENQLILAEFKELGYNFPDSIIDDVLRDRIRERFGDRVRFTQTLKAQGTTFEQYRKDTKEQMIIEQLRYKNINPNKLVVSPARMEAFYKENLKTYQLGDQVKLRMITINQPPGASKGTAVKIAGEVLGKIKDGASFTEMATVYSDGSTKASGGDRGWVERSFLKKELSDVAFSLKAGQISGVIEQPEGAYILLVEEVRISYTRPLEEVRDEIERELRGRERARLMKNWVDKLKAKNFVRYF